MQFIVQIVSKKRECCRDLAFYRDTRHSRDSSLSVRRHQTVVTTLEQRISLNADQQATAIYKRGSELQHPSSLHHSACKSINFSTHPHLFIDSSHSKTLSLLIHRFLVHTRRHKSKHQRWNLQHFPQTQSPGPAKLPPQQWARRPRC